MKMFLAKWATKLATRLFPKGKKLAAGMVILVLPVIFMLIPGSYDEFLSIAEWVVTQSQKD